MIRPPGVNQGTFAAALQKFADAIGKQWVFTSDEDVDLYRDSYSVYKGEKEEYLASAALAPDTVEQVQAIVRIANQYKIPIYPFSTGRNLGYGGSAPSYSGSVVLDLYPSPPAPGWGSPVGNALDHGAGSPARDNFKNHCGMEIVLPNGDVLRTGMGSLPNAQTWQT